MNVKAFAVIGGMAAVRVALLSFHFCYFAPVSLILTIDTAVEGASLCLAEGPTIIAFKENKEQREAAAWLQPAIHQLCFDAGVNLAGLSAIAVSAGPGSYTGLRVGMATAKGLCYALGLPLIAINTLKMMAAAALPAQGLLCPMIDARRMEVFTAVFDENLAEVRSTTNLILDETSLNDLLEEQPVLFFGNGSEKFKPLVKHPNALFAEVIATAQNLVPLSVKALAEKDFADLAYSEPYYGKAFFSPHFKPSV